MVELSILVLLAGLIRSSTHSMQIFNPFQIYFAIWFLIIAVCYVTSELFIEASFLFHFLILLIHLTALLCLNISLPSSHIIIQKQLKIHFIIVREKILLLLQIAIIIAIPFAYQKAMQISGGADILSVEGYIRLRSSMTQDDESMGVWAYFPTLSFVIVAVRMHLWMQSKRGVVLLIIAGVTSIFYAYLGTGRTAFLLLLSLVLIPLVLRRYIGKKGIVFSILILVLSFVLIATMTAKGISENANMTENFFSLIDNLQGYTIAPLIAFSQLVDGNYVLTYGENTFRFFIAILSKIGLTDIKPIRLIREFAYVPMPTNVYTAYEVYFKDFWIFGLLVPPAFLLGHWWLYTRALRIGGAWLFLYAASVYPLVMQFFQDQYVSLFSTWIQLTFWFFLLIRPSRLQQSIPTNNQINKIVTC